MIQPRNVIRRYTSIPAVIDMLRNRELTLVDPAAWDDRNDRYFMELYREARNFGGLYAACAATGPETYHHWRVFTTGAAGACVEIFREPLENALNRIPKVSFGEVDYLRLEDVERLTEADLENLPFFKRVAFQPEQEYRIVVETSEPQEAIIGLGLPLNWIGRILLNPWLPERVAQSVKATLQEIDGCENLIVERSHMIENARWKRAGEVVVGVRPPRRTRKR